MERHKCKLCSRSFSNGRALGGHMRSHLATLPVPPKIQPQQQQQLGDQTESASFLSSSEEEERESEEKCLGYVLRENPKKSFRMVDPEFLDAGSVVQDRESETESTRNATRQRSKRTRKMGEAESHDREVKKPKLRKPSSTGSTTELEPGSSASDTSPEEDVALCLMMLSRDTWSSDESKQRPRQGKYQCETCKKVFRSFQALGGHRTSHKKTMKNSFQDHEDDSPAPPRHVGGSKNVDQKVYECPFCDKVFGSGQALGGHKRSHFLASPSTPPPKFGDSLVDTKLSDSLIDLNLPAPMEDEDLSQLEVSAISEAEFVTNSTKH